jgi:hypothetical protein
MAEASKSPTEVKGHKDKRDEWLRPLPVQDAWHQLQKNMDLRDWQ